MLLDHADFALQEQAEDNLMVAFSWAWYNGSHTMTAKPIKSLELHYTVIQFLIKHNIPFMLVGYEMIDTRSQWGDYLFNNVIIFTSALWKWEYRDPTRRLAIIILYIQQVGVE